MVMPVPMVMPVTMIVIMGMIVLVPVKRQRPMGPGAEQRPVFRGRADDFGRAFAADMPVQTDHAVARAHHHV